MDLVAKHPELKNMREMRLSDDIEQQRQQVAQQTDDKKRAKTWIPPDAVPIKIIGNGKQAAVAYQFRIAFYDLPSDVQLKELPGENAGFFRGDRQISPKDLQSKKVIAFKRSVRILLDNSPVNQNSIFVCNSAVGSSYAAMSDEETKMTMAMTNNTAMPWMNKSGAIEHFCGIISLAGKIMFAFQMPERPGIVMAPVGISADGTRAAIMFGKQSKAEGGEGYYIRPQEVVVWHYPNKITTKKITNPSLTDYDVRRQFYSGEL